MKTEPKLTWNINHKALGHYLRQLREAAGLGVTEVARYMDVPGHEVLRLEQGRSNWVPMTMDKYLYAIGQ